MQALENRGSKNEDRNTKNFVKEVFSSNDLRGKGLKEHPFPLAQSE